MGIHSLGRCPDARKVTPGATKRQPAPADYNEPGSIGLLDSFDETIDNANDLASVIRRRPMRLRRRQSAALTMLAVFAGSR